MMRTGRALIPISPLSQTAPRDTPMIMIRIRMIRRLWMILRFIDPYQSAEAENDGNSPSFLFCSAKSAGKVLIPLTQPSFHHPYPVISRSIPASCSRVCITMHICFIRSNDSPWSGLSSSWHGMCTWSYATQGSCRLICA